WPRTFEPATGPLYTPRAPRPTVATPHVTVPRPTTARVLAAGGAIVTLIGVALLLALAAQAGLLGPAVRVGLGGTLAVALTGAALWSSTRPGGRVGAVALGATGAAAGYLDVVAATGIYGWLPPAVGLVLAGAIALGGLALAARWRSEWFGILVLAPLYVLAPALADDGYLLGAFTLVLAAATVPIGRPRRWPWLHLVCSVGTAVTLGTLLIAATAAEAPAAVAAALAAGLVGLWAAADPEVRAGNRTPVLAGGLIGLLPLLAAPVSAPDRLAAAGLMLGALGAALVAWLPGTTQRVRGAWYSAAGVAGAAAALVALGAATGAAVLVACGAALLAFAGRDAATRWAGLVLGTAGGLLMLPDLVATTVDESRWAPLGSAAVLAGSACGIAFALVGAWRFGPGESSWGTGAVAALAFATALSANAGYALGGHTGYLWGHGVATVLWIAAGAAALAVSRRRGRAGARAAGLAMIGGAVAKLFLFDLAALDGLVRAVAFLLVGGGLLGVGTLYARALPDLSGRR
ncbi:DUF2339 domain-containing protein, partial [Tsukamurella sp. 8J]